MGSKIRTSNLIQNEISQQKLWFSKILKTIIVHTKSTDLILCVFKKNIHLLTQSFEKLKMFVFFSPSSINQLSSKLIHRESELLFFHTFFINNRFTS